MTTETDANANADTDASVDADRVDTAVVIYEGFEELDAVGPYDVLAEAGERGGPFDVSLVTREPTDRVRAVHGLSVEPDGVLASEADLLVVPGGGWNDRSAAGAWSQVEDGRLPAAVADAAAAGATVASVCTGAMILAHAGLLDGRPATTHAGARGDLAVFADVREERVVSVGCGSGSTGDVGPVITAGGVTAGIDLALYLIEGYAGPGLAGEVRTGIEYPVGGE
jgi:transcriptional regulator GlxA family with amidase domain